MKARPHKTKLIIAAVVGVIVVAAAYVLLTGEQVRYNNVAAVRSDSGLALVLPTSLPPNSSITDHPTYNQATQNITTRLKVEGHAVTFSQQRRPETDLKQIDALETFLVNAGSVYILKGEEGRLQAIVETSDSWLMVNTDAKIGNGSFKTILESLTVL